MGRTLGTSFAIYDGSRISVADARKMQEQGDSLTGKLVCVECGSPVKFVCSTDNKRDMYFAHIGKGSGKDYLAKHDREGYLHKLAKLCYKNLTFSRLCVGTDAYLDVADIIDVELEKRIDVVMPNKDVRTVIPDVTVETSYATYFFEVYSTHKVTSKKLATYYMYNSSQSVKPCHVVEVYIGDIAEKVADYSYENLFTILLARLGTSSNYVKELYMRDALHKEYDFLESMFGRCWCCNSPLELSMNSEDMSFSSLALQSKRVTTAKLADLDARSSGDRTTLGSVMLHCPKCVENRYFPIICPEHQKKGYIVPMKFLRNKSNGRYYLACSGYVTSEYKDFECSDSCQCSLTLFESDGYTYADEILAVKGLATWLSSGGTVRSMSDKSLNNLRYKKGSK